MHDPKTDPVQLAGWVEYKVNLTDHFFADGCGKISQALSSWVLMKGGMPLPTYTSRDELYAHAPQNMIAEGKDPKEEWLSYFKSKCEAL